MKITRFSIRRPVFTFVTMLLVLILGGVSVVNIPLKLIPEINPPIGVVVTSYQGASPNEVVEKVSKPLEEALSTLQGLDTLTSTSQENSSLVILQFSWATKIDDIQDEIRMKLQDVTLPEDAGEPRFLKFDPSQFPIIQLSLTSNVNTEHLQLLAEELKEVLLKTEGVGSINLSGVIEDEISVVLDPDKLRNYSLSQSEIVDMIRANVVTTPGDPVKSEDKLLTTRVLSMIESVEELENIPLKRDLTNGDQIALKDVGNVAVTPIESNTITRLNQQPAILVSVLQQSDANTAAVSDAFQKNLDELLKEKKYSEISAEIIFDQGKYIDQAIGNMVKTLLIGGLLAMLVLFIFLRSVKSPFIIGIAIPYSVIVTFILMYFSNFTLNIMTLGGLALGIGMLVDNAIVVIESIYRHLALGKSPREAAYIGAKEIGPAIIASTLTTVAVFLPVVFLTGIIGDLFKEFALTIAFSLVASLFVALTIVPMLASQLLKNQRIDREQKPSFSYFMSSLENTIKWCLRNRGIVISLALIVFFVSIYGLTRVGAVFLPKTDEGFFTIHVKVENGTPLSETVKVVHEIESELENDQNVQAIVSLVGSTQEELFRGTGSSNVAELYVKMSDTQNRNKSTFDFIDEEKKRIEHVAKRMNQSAELTFHTQSSTGSNQNIVTFDVKSTEKSLLDESIVKIDEALASIKTIEDIENDLVDKIKEVQITVDRKKAFENGLTPAQIGKVVNDATRGASAVQLTTTNKEIYMVIVRYEKRVKENIDSLKRLIIKKPDQTFIELKKVATFHVGEGPVSIKRVNKQSAIQYNVRYSNETNLGDISSVINDEIEKLDLSEDIDISYRGDRELLESSSDDMILAFILAVIFIYIVMAAQFESFKYPFVIMFTLPLMIIGASASLVLSKTPISLMVVIGIIVLAGIVVNNAIVIVDYINQLKQQGQKTYEAIIDAVNIRVRPILMTALTTILGLIPLALGLGEGTEINQAMGLTVIGGIISSTLLTLFVIPVVYSLFDKETRRLNKVYVTPEGHAVRMLDVALNNEEQKKAASVTEDTDTTRSTSREPYKKEDLINMLAQIMDMLKDKK